jgi:hypothetical protein
MNTYRPEADTEYSRGRDVPDGDSEAVPSRSAARPSGRWTAILGGGLLGSALLLGAEFTPLLNIHSGARAGGVIETVQAGSHHAYALVPVALLAAALSINAWMSRTRLALASIGAMGLVALGIAVIGDLPDVHTSGLIRRPGGAYVSASTSAGIGLYLETLGAIVLLITAGAGLLLRPGGRAGRRAW